MNYLGLATIFASYLLLSSCTPLSAVSMIGGTLLRTAERKALENENTPTIIPDEVAIANINLGIEYMKQENYEKALEKLNRAKEANTAYPPTYNALGLVYQQMGEPEKAELNFKKSIKLDKTDPNALNNYGQFLCSDNRVSEAEEYFLAAATNPFYESPDLPYANIGTCAKMHGHTEKAVTYYNKALSINPRIPTVLFQMSEISYEKKDYLSARNYLKQYLELSKHSAKSLWLGIRIESELGDKDAVSSYAMLLRNDFSEAKEVKLIQNIR